MADRKKHPRVINVRSMRVCIEEGEGLVSWPGGGCAVPPGGSRCRQAGAVAEAGAEAVTLSATIRRGLCRGWYGDW